MPSAFSRPIGDPAARRSRVRDQPGPGSHVYSAVRYEAMIMVGYNTSERDLADWNDVYGGHFSEALGYGSRAGDEVRFGFEYPDGPFHSTRRWLPDSHPWNWHMQTRDKSGNGPTFSNSPWLAPSNINESGSVHCK